MERIKHVVQINILLGGWLIIAPFVMGYSGSTAELATDVALGIWFIACSWWILSAGRGQVAAGTLELLGSIALVAIPFAVHYQRMSRPFDNDIVVGIAAVIVSGTATWMLATRFRTAGTVRQ